MSDHGVLVPVGHVAETPSAAREAAIKLGMPWETQTHAQMRQ